MSCLLEGCRNQVACAYQTQQLAAIYGQTRGRDRESLVHALQVGMAFCPCVLPVRGHSQRSVNAQSTLSQRYSQRYSQR